MTTANIGPLARFVYTPDSDTWWWSDEAFRVFGFSPGEVVPTTELVLRHQHPDDVDAAAELARSQVAQGEGFCVWHRIVDARGRARQLVTLAEGAWDDTGACTELRGGFLDVTRALRASYSRDVDDAVQASARTRAAIEQAKGALMLSHRIGAEQAFQLLRSCSQATNVKVRDLAGAVVRAIVETGQLPPLVRRQTAAFADGSASAGQPDGVLCDPLDGVRDRGGDPVG